jgi:hypothetical protein
MNTATTTLTLNEGHVPPQLAGLAVCRLVVAWAGCSRCSAMRLHGCVRKRHPAGLHSPAIWLGWFWRPLRVLMLVVAAFSLLAIGLYQGSLARAEHGVLAQVLPVQPVGHPVDEHAVLHEHAVLLDRHVRARRGRTMELLGSRLAWVAVAMALIGTMVRWYESYLIGPTWATSR